MAERLVAPQLPDLPVFDRFRRLYPKQAAALADLRESGLISAEESEEVLQAYNVFYHKGEARLIEIVSSKETDVITQTVSLLDKHSLPEMSSVLKVMVEVQTANLLSEEKCRAIFGDYHKWEFNLMQASLRDTNTMFEVASILKKHQFSSITLKALAELRESGLLSAEECKCIVREYSLVNNKWQSTLMTIALFKQNHVIIQIVSLLEKHSLTWLSEALKVTSMVCEQLMKKPSSKNGNFKKVIVALCWLLMLWESKRHTDYLEPERVEDTLVKKLQVIGDLIMKPPDEPHYLPAFQSPSDTGFLENVHPSLLQGYIIQLLQSSIASGGTDVQDKLTVLILCYWEDWISEDECKRVYSLAEWRREMEGLQKPPDVMESIGDVLNGEWRQYIYRLHDKNIKLLLQEQDFQDKLIKAASNRGGSVQVEIMKCVTLGPPEAGKSQLKKALSGNFEASSESTPVSTAAEVVLECFVEGELTWDRLDTEQLQSALHTTIEEEDYEPHPSQLDTSQKLTEEATSISEDESSSGSTASVTLQDTKQIREPMVHTTPPTPLVPMQEDSRIRAAFSKERERVRQNLSRATARKHLNNVRLIHIIDSGGQPAFFDLHPMLATSRSLYFLLFNSCEGLLAYPKMTYRKPSEFPTRSILNTTQTNLDLIKLSLYTLHHCKDKFLRMEEELKRRLSDGIAFESHDVLPVIIVGSRKSQQSQDETKASELLMSSCCHIPTWQDTQPYITMVESLDPSCTGVKELRKAVSKAESNFKIRLPLSWLQCQLTFWSTDDPALSVMTYQDLKTLCTEDQLVSSDEEFLAMLSTLHMLGIFSCPTIDHITVDPDSGDRLHPSPVFTKPDVLYQQVSRILEIPFRAFNAPGQDLTTTERKNLEKLQRSGELTADSLSILGVPDTLGSFPRFRSFLLKSLVRWGLAAEVSQDPLQLFIPSILPPRKDHVPTTSQSPIPSLALTITNEDTGDYYVPQGIFPHFVVSVMKRRSDGYGLDVGVGDATPRCRDAINFHKKPHEPTRFHYNIQVVDRIDHISVHITPALKGKDRKYRWSPEDCHVIIEDLKHSMEEAYNRLYQKSQLCSVILCCPCTLCPLSEKKEHLAHLNPEDLTMHCLSRECEDIYVECDGVLEAILEGPKLTQRKGSPSSSDSTSIPKRQDIASELNCEQFMDKYKGRFLEVVAAKDIAGRLEIDGIIPSRLHHAIEQTDPDKARELLYRHLCQHGAPSTIRPLCDIMANESGYPKMNSLGKDMKENKDLPRDLSSPSERM